ncbi:MAG: hypothetical protein JWM71_142 [Solirubrobacteraceae bacterium]|nr:hypothetical protein [Solirubrobacteraceae bacterium]
MLIGTTGSVFEPAQVPLAVDVVTDMRLVLGALACLIAAAPAAAESNIPVAGLTAPVLRSQVAAGGGTAVALRAAHDPAHAIDGKAGDWTGALPGFGGAEDYSHGELVYEDHIFDAYGADNGQDAQRLSVLDPATQAVPEFYRLDPAYQYVPGEFGIPTGPLVTETHYGDQPHADEADLSEVRLADSSGNLDLLARTTTMTQPDTALLVLLDTAPGSTTRSVPFNSGLKTAKAEVAVLLTAGGGKVADLATGAITDLPAGSVAYDPTGYANTIEARLPKALLGADAHSVGVAVASGIAAGDKLKSLGDSTSNPSAVNVANVAFRTSEPARNWFDKQQALALYAGSIDDFFTTADLDRMRAGANERYVPGPGYHDRIFTSAPEISQEKGQDGLLQHYGVYLPSGYRAGTRSATQYWFHFRGGDAHIAAAVVPGIFEDMGENYHSLVITPDGRGTSGWYVGKSQADVLEVWKDSHRMFSIDRNRTYIAGHSMGGWASYLLPIEHPDWFAAAFPASGPPTQGAWTGIDAGSQCDSLSVAGDGACFTDANGGRSRDEWTTPLLENLRHVPYAIYQGVEDELVPVSGVLMQAKRLQDLGYRYRLYLFHGQEHYGPPIVDQWAEGAAYEHQFVRDPNPAEVTYIRSMPFERAIEEVNTDGTQTKRFAFPLDHAYWMSGLQPADPDKGVAHFDATSLAIPQPGHSTVPEAGAGPQIGQGSPYTMTGQAWKTDTSTTPATSNRFTATLTGAAAVTLNLARMQLSTHRALTGTVAADKPLALTLRGVTRHVTVTVDGAAASTSRNGRALTVDVPAGQHTVLVSPA